MSVIKKAFAFLLGHVVDTVKEEVTSTTTLVRGGCYLGMIVIVAIVLGGLYAIIF